MHIALASSAADHAGDTDLPQLIAAAEVLGHTATVAIWDDPAVDWNSFDVLAVRSCWDYTTRRDEFVAWCQSNDQHLTNAAAVIAWNSNKTYLRDLEQAGVAIIPTLWDARTTGELGEHRSWVVKPTISSGSANTAHWTTAEAAASHSEELLAAGKHTMTQPYVASIDTVGEFANYFFGGRYSHTVRKPALLEADQTPAATASFPAGLRAINVDSEMLAFSEGVLRQAELITGKSIVQARVDVVLDDNNKPMLMELELVEPALFLDFVPSAAETYIRAVIAARE